MTSSVPLGLRLLVSALAIAFLLCLASLRPASAHHPDEPDTPPVDDPPPGVFPDRVILTWTGDPATTQAVTWRTAMAVEKGLAQVAVSEAGPAFELKTRDFPAVSQPLATDRGEARYHTTVFDELVPDTKYVYRVGDGEHWSEWFQFRTASASAAPFSFIYFGDAQNQIKSHWSRVIREAWTDAPKSRFMIHAGDLVNHGDADLEWGEWFRAGGWMNGMIPSIPVPGNHEYPRDEPMSESRHLSRHWRPQFALPEHGPPGLEETVYKIDFQGVRIICLNSNRDQERQREWLERALAGNPNTWIVMVFHHPIFSSAKGRDNPTLRETWKPLFDKYRVDLVLQGHDHSYARFGSPHDENVPTGVTASSEAGGTVYVVSVSGPKMYRVERRPEMRRAAEDTQLYQIVHTSGTTLRYEARTATGDLYDSFTLEKSPGAPNRMFEHIPPTPERLRPADDTEGQ